MSKKSITFVQKDSELIQKIETYQKAKEMKSFIDAVRDLCKKGLRADEFAKKNV